MSFNPDSIACIRGFVSGELDASAFEQQLYTDPQIEVLLSQTKAPSYSRGGTTLYEHLIALDYADPGDVLDAHALLTTVLDGLGVEVVPSSAPADLHAVLLAAQPRWLDADLAFVASVLAEAPAMPPGERKVWLRQRLLELFRFTGKPPRWLQSPAWPVGDAGPLVFLGQLPIDGACHDDAFVYVFHDRASGTCRTIIQMA